MAKHLTIMPANTHKNNAHTPPMTSGIIVSGGQRQNESLNENVFVCVT